MKVALSLNKKNKKYQRDIGMKIKLVSQMMNLNLTQIKK